MNVLFWNLIFSLPKMYLLVLLELQSCLRKSADNFLEFILQDGKLSKDEILEHYDLFVGSQATDFGEALTRHDEF